MNEIDVSIKTESKRVWIGDPCYVIEDSRWDNVCKQIYDSDGKEVGHVITLDYEKSYDFIQCGTAYGDGRFPSETGFKYGVDSGGLAIVPERLIKEGVNDEFGQYFEIESGNVSLLTKSDGTFIFRDGSHVIETILTGDVDDYEEDYEDEDEDYEDDDDEGEDE